MTDAESVSMNHRKYEVKTISVVANPVSSWCGYANQGMKNASGLPHC